MKHPSPGDGRYDTVASLQARLVRWTATGTPSERFPGSTYSQAVERAIDYALSQRRTEQESSFLEHDVLRNARCAIQRSGRAEQRTVEAIASASSALDPGFHGGVRATAQGRPERAEFTRRRHVAARPGQVAGTAVVSHVSPEDVAIGQDLERRIRTRSVSELGSLAGRVLDGLVDGDTVLESAARLRVSARTVDRYRARIRSIAGATVNATEPAA